MTKYNFENGWGVSIIDDGYGVDEGLLELAVLKDGCLHFANPVAQGDVRGWLDDDMVSELSERVRAFKPNETFPKFAHYDNDDEEGE